MVHSLTQASHQISQSLWRRLSHADLRVDSLYNTYRIVYNTYRIVGLPPQPVANSGREALRASLHPEHHPCLYFVANGTGGHVFAITLAEHNRNVERYRQFMLSDDQDS